MSSKKLLYFIIPAILIIVLLGFYPKFFANRIYPHFNQAKMDEVKQRNEALFNEMLSNFKKDQDKIRKNPADAGAWNELAVIADTFGDDVLAEKAYKKAIELDANSSFLARTNLAALYLRQEKYSDAETLYKEILKNNPSDIQTHESLARLYASGKIGTIEDAKRVLEEGIKLTNDSYLKELLARLQRGEAL